MSRFKNSVIKVVRSIPKGQVASYGQIAAIIGLPRAALQVGWVLSSCGNDGITPWWRVVNKDGVITIKNSKYSANLQKKLLEKDGIFVTKDMKVNIKKHRFNPSDSVLSYISDQENGYIEGLEERFKI